MLVVTTSSIEGRKITQYLGLVSGDAILGANIFRDFFAGIRDIVGGRSAAYEKELRKAYGADGAKKVMRRLSDLRAAATLEDMRNLLGRIHELTGDRDGQLAIDLAGGWRLILAPTHGWPAEKAEGAHVWNAIDAVTVVVAEGQLDHAKAVLAAGGVTDATVIVGGTGLKPEITFASVPQLPQDELLSRILFGTSITNLSAPEALQLASAVAALQSGSGSLDPINSLRRAVGLDRLRILPADIATGQKTAVAAGKYVTRKLFVEVITDGQGYSATRAEFQVTRWLSLLSSISTIGRTSANVRISKDY